MKKYTLVSSVPVVKRYFDVDKLMSMDVGHSIMLAALQGQSNTTYQLLWRTYITHMHHRKPDNATVIMA